jgi:hypothetical protein
VGRQDRRPAVLTVRELNRATLARQLLLERKRLSPLQAIERLVGLQAQWPQAPYVGLWTRLAGFRRERLERLLLRGDVVKATVMRGTLHLVSRRDYALLWELLHEKMFASDKEAVAHGVAHAPVLRGLAPLTFNEAVAHLRELHGVEEQTARRAWYVARVRAHLLHHHETALWTARPEARFVAADEPERVDRAAAATEIVHRYLAAFGPAAKADIARWGHLTVGEFAHALDGLPTYRDERGRTLYDVPRAPRPAADTAVPVRFLPKWDNVILGFDDRTRILPDALKTTIIGKNGDVAQTVLVDGVVVGTWDRNVEVTYLAPVTRTQKAEVAAEAGRLKAWLQG